MRRIEDFEDVKNSPHIMMSRKLTAKKKLLRFGIWGLVANVIKFHLPVSNKSDLGAPSRKITKRRF